MMDTDLNSFRLQPHPIAFESRDIIVPLAQRLTTIGNVKRWLTPRTWTVNDIFEKRRVWLISLYSF